MEEESDFCSELRIKTKNVHDQSDKLINLKLAIALTDTTLYGTVLVDFYYVYLTIEECLNQLSDHHHVGRLRTDGLSRADALELDIQHFLGLNWRNDFKPSKEAQEYCDRILHIRNHNPSLLIAYIHSMYLAILAGGQIIQKIIKRTLGISGENGLAVFQFPPEYNKLQLKKDLIQSINSLDIDRELKEKILAEKRLVFKMNNSIAGNVHPTVGSFSRIIKLLLICLIFIIAISNVIVMIWI